jgi:hypothetical protein
MPPPFLPCPVVLSVTMLFSRSHPGRSHAAQRSAMSNATALAPLVTSAQAVDYRAFFVRGDLVADAAAAAPEGTALPDSASAVAGVPAEPIAAPARTAEAPAGGAAQAPAPTRPPGGFLAELELEARERQTESGPDRETIERNTRLANIACRAITDYWRQLVEHLNALTPVAPGRYVLDGRTVLENLPAHGFRVIPNLRTAHTGTEHFESVLLCWRVGKGDRLKLVKEFPAEIARLKSRLSFAGINASESQARDPDSGRYRGTLFELAADVNASVLITPLHDDGKVRLTLTNLDALQRIEAELPAFAMRPHELDELARWICGRTHSLLKHAQNIVRHEP